MELADLLAPAQVRTLGSIASKKRALEELSKLLVEVAPDLSASDVLTSLVNREKLGSTALKGGVAIPHGRMRGLDKPAAAFVRLESGIDYDADDGSEGRSDLRPAGPAGCDANPSGNPQDHRGAVVRRRIRSGDARCHLGRGVA